MIAKHANGMLLLLEVVVDEKKDYCLNFFKKTERVKKPFILTQFGLLSFGIHITFQTREHTEKR